LNAGGYFEDQTIQLPAGTHSISASYGGDHSFNASGPVSNTITVTQAATTTAVSASQATVPPGTAVTLTATVSTQSNATANPSQEPNGMVQFFNGGVALSGPVTVTGGINQTTMFAQATASISPTLSAAQNVITAKYLGDSNYAASAVSPSVSVAVGTIGVSPGCASSTIAISAPGQPGSCLITATGATGFVGTVTLSVALTNMPTGALDVPTCNSFGAPDQNFTTPNIITLTSTSETGNATMTCSSTAASGIVLRPSNRPLGTGWFLAGATISLACFLLLLTLQREKRWRLIPLVALLVIAGAALMSCGSSSSGGGGGQSNPGTTTGAYTFTITATPSSGTAQTTTITVNVQ
jgi:hypothetical protein